jgi:hypothetical protein
MKSKTAIYIYTISLSVILFISFFAVFVYFKGFRGDQPSAITFTLSETQSISVFAPGENGILKRETLDAPQQLPEKAKGEFIFRSLKEERCIPDRLKLQDLAFGKDGVIYLNVSKEFVEKTFPEREITMTYGLVNSFIESFRGAKSVQILVDGQPVYTKNGILYIFEPLEFNRDVMEE